VSCSIAGCNAKHANLQDKRLHTTKVGHENTA
jgi:hypothetical protein